MIINLVFSLTRGGSHNVPAQQTPNGIFNKYALTHSVCMIHPGTLFTAATTDQVSSIYISLNTFGRSDTQSYTDQLQLLWVGVPNEYTGTKTTNSGSSPFYTHHTTINTTQLALPSYSKYTLFSNDYVTDIYCRPTEIMVLKDGAGTDIVGTINGTAFRVFSTSFYCNYAFQNTINGLVMLPQGTQSDDIVYTGCWYTPTDSNGNVVPFNTLSGVILSNADAFTTMTQGYTLRFVAGEIQLEYFNGVGTTQLTYDLSTRRASTIHIAALFNKDGGAIYLNGHEVASSVDLMSSGAATLYPSLGAWSGIPGIVAPTDYLPGIYDIYFAYEGDNCANMTERVRESIAEEQHSTCGYKIEGQSFTPLLPTWQFNFDDDEFDAIDTHSRVKFGEQDRQEVTFELS